MRITESQLRRVVKKLLNEQQLGATQYYDSNTAWNYLKNNFTYVPEKSRVDRPYGQYRGYEVGTLRYKKNDMGTVTPDDLEILNKISMGQSTRWLINPEDPSEIKVNYTCDSTD